MIKRKKKFRIKALFVVAFALLFLCTTAQAQTPVKMSNYSPTADYVSVLSSANIFLSAWRDRNIEKGLEFVSPALKKKMSNEDLAAYISGTSSPSHSSFEVSSGKKLKDGRYSFDVKMFEYYRPGEPEFQSWKCPEFSTIVLVKIGSLESNEKTKHSNWMVDKLPEICELSLNEGRRKKEVFRRGLGSQLKTDDMNEVGVLKRTARIK
jgi:hypothetical protein